MFDNIVRPDFSEASAKVVKRYNNRIRIGQMLGVPLTLAGLVFGTWCRVGTEPFLGMAPQDMSLFMRYSSVDIFHAAGFLGFIHTAQTWEERSEAQNYLPSGKIAPLPYGKPGLDTGILMGLGTGIELMEMNWPHRTGFDWNDMAAYAVGCGGFYLYHAALRAWAWRGAQRDMRMGL